MELAQCKLSSLAERLNDGRLPDGKVVANLESEIRKLCDVGGDGSEWRQCISSQRIVHITAAARRAAAHSDRPELRLEQAVSNRRSMDRSEKTERLC